MKKTFVVVTVLLLLAAAGNSWAQLVIGFPVKFKGLVEYPHDSNSVVKVGATEVNLMSSPTHHLVMVVDLVGHDMQLVEATSSNTFVATLMTSRRLALLPDNTFAAGMQFQFTLPPPGAGVDGDLVFSGKIAVSKGVPKSLSATVVGVLNDHVNGDVLDGDITVKGKVTPDGAPFDGTPLLPVN
jgi:hypothetical protein